MPQSRFSWPRALADRKPVEEREASEATGTTCHSNDSRLIDSSPRQSRPPFFPWKNHKQHAGAIVVAHLLRACSVPVWISIAFILLFFFPMIPSRNKTGGIGSRALLTRRSADEAKRKPRTTSSICADKDATRQQMQMKMKKTLL